MNAVAMEQAATDEFIFGNQLLHERFFTAIELIAQVVVATPRSVSATTLAATLGQPLRVVRALLQSLCKSELVQADEKARDCWYCAGAPGGITLADIFHCVASPTVDAAGTRKRKGAVPSVIPRSGTQQSIDLLLMQATMAVNQVVLQHLQQFDLGRLRAVTSAVPFRMVSPGQAAYSAEAC